MASPTPLSFAQQRLWFLDQLSPGTALYNVPLVLDLEGFVDVDALERALREIVQRHEPLRTVFPSEGGLPRQHVRASEWFMLSVENLETGNAAQDTQRLEHRILEEVRRPFDLANGPVFRATLASTTATTHALIVMIHHISFDGWSSGVFFRELSALYGAFLIGQPSPLPDLPISYREYSTRQRDDAGSERVQRQLSYWVDTLRPPRPTLALPADRPRPAVQTHRGWRVTAPLPTHLMAALHDLARREGVTLFMAVLAAHATLLHALAGQDDVIVGTPIANRTRPDLEPLIGFFANSLALRLDLSGDPPFRTLLQQAKRVALDAFGHQDVPFERIVEALNPERTLTHAPIAQTFLVLDNSPRAFSDALTIGGLVMRRRAVDTGTSKFDLTLVLRPREEARRATVEVNADLFDEPAAPRLLRMMTTLFEGMVSNPDRTISRLPLLSAHDRHQVAVDWSHGRPCAQDTRTIINLFEEQAIRHADDVAIICGEERVTYASLQGRVRALARRLAASGVAPEDRVGICMTRSADLVVAVLAVLKAGGAYVPLDAVNPDDRLRFISADAGCAMVLTDAVTAGRVAAWAPHALVVDGFPAGEADARDDIGPTDDGTRLAYVIFTSGSTGVPKGVAVEHRQVVNLVRWAVETWSDHECSGMLASTPLGFDLSVFELFVPLCAGTTVILVDHLLALSRAPARAQVTFLNTVPSVMAEYLRRAVLPEGVSVVALAGEPLSQSLVTDIQRHSPIVAVFDLYGPTETTVYATFAQRTADGPTTIGRPVANATVLVLDSEGRPVPVGVAGELFIGGAGVARGYWGRADLTAERFVVDPMPDASSGRMYRTGDRVRWRSDGTLEFIGRADRQVKIRGLRIELGEIEAALLDQPSVREAVALRSEAADGVARLVACIAVETPVDDEAIYAQLERRLPHYMVPTALVRLTALPRLPNGKVDYETLRGHAVSDSAASAPRAPRTRVIDAMRAQLMEWAGSTRPYPRQREVSSLFEDQARRTPEAPAITGDTETISYRELDERANRLAHHIRAWTRRTSGGEPARHGEPVGVLLERSADAIVVLLAILKAGHAYLPLDPASPPARIAALAEQAELAFVVTRQALVSLLPATHVAVLSVDAESDRIGTRLATAVERTSSSEALAYVLFTSGTTGVPKAVGVPHRAIVNLAFGLPDVPLGAGETSMHLAPLTFDAATFEIWGSLLRGGMVAVAPEHAITASALERFIAAHRVTVMFLTASLFNAVVDDHPESLTALRTLVIGGEALSAPHVTRALAALPHTRLLNGYGPTETTTFATTYVLGGSDVEGGRPIPIGTPLPNTRVYVLDADRQLVPPGADGELWIGGDGVAHGYLNDPGQTAAKFVVDPFAGDGRRMYRTGDRARFRPDGVLDFLGRNDDQIKVRGFRIEPGEVEAALAAHPRVRGSVVGLVDLPAAGRTLVAFVVPRSTDVSGTSLHAQLRDFLRQRLPEHMVPTQWIAISAIPLLRSGKTDRQTLAAMAVASKGETTTEVEHTTSRTETVIAAIWRSVLGLSHINVDQNFFDIGGHSLLATQVLSRVRTEMGVDINLRDLFAAPTVAALARDVDQRQGALDDTSPTSYSAIQTASRPDVLPLSFAQQRLWFLHQWYQRSAVYNIPTAFRLVGPLDVAALTRALQHVVDRHEALRTVLPLVGGRPIQRVLEHGEVSISLVDLSSLPRDAAEHSARRLVDDEVRRPFDLAVGPLFRVSLVRLQTEVHLLLLVVHHVAADGWSLGVVFHELQVGYDAVRRGVRSHLDPLPVQYADFALWQRQYLRGPVLDRHLAHWRRQLSPLPPVLAMPLDHPRPVETTTRGGHVSFDVDPDLAAAVARFSSDGRATLFVTLLAVYQSLLHHYTGLVDLCVGTPIANRTRQEIEPLIGCFVNTIAIRVTLSDDTTFRELVRRTRSAVIDAQQHQDLPFEVLVDALNIERRSDQAPLFQTMFIVQEGLDYSLQLSDLVVSRESVAFDFAKFEITVSLRPVEGGLRGRVEYNADLFDRDTAVAVGDDFVTLLMAVLEEPDRKLSAIVLPGAERRRVRARVGPAPQSLSETLQGLPSATGATGDIEQRLVSIWQRVLESSAVATTDNFFALGGHSLLAIRLFSEVEEAFGVRLPLSTLFRNGTIEAQARLLAADTRKPSWSPLVAIQPLGERPPFFLVHGVGGEVLSFQLLAEHLGPNQPIFGFQASGNDDDQREVTIEAVAARYVDAMCAVAPRGPYRLGGYSAGGAIAYEMAQQLRARGEVVALLAMVDAFAPQLKPAPLTPSVIWRLVRNAAYWPLDDEFLRSGWAAQRARVRSKVKAIQSRRQAGSVASALDAGADVRDLLGIWRVPDRARAFLERYVRMMGAYRPSPYPGAVTVFRARTLSLSFRGTADLGWGTLAASVVTHVVPGAHDTILQEPRVRELADRLAASLQASA